MRAKRLGIPKLTLYCHSRHSGDSEVWHLQGEESPHLTRQDVLDLIGRDSQQHELLHDEVQPGPLVTVYVLACIEEAGTVTAAQSCALEVDGQKLQHFADGLSVLFEPATVQVCTL